MNGGAAAWAIVVPVKRLAVAKTRMTWSPRSRADLALAMALDTVRAALGCAGVATVVAVTDEERAATRLRAIGAQVVADEPDAGLNAALLHGAAAADALSGPRRTRVAALASDLPALRADDLAVVLDRAVGTSLAMVADAAGDGTTLLAASSVDAFHPSFGVGSRAAHVLVGAVDLSAAAGASVRRDVDTVDDLAAAVRLGVGPATTALLRRHPDLVA